MVSMPPIVLSADSIGRAISLSIVSGDAPVYPAVTTTMGRSRLGELIHTKPTEREEADDQNGHHHHGGEDRVADADAGEKHGVTSPRPFTGVSATS
jgi:hypothetical protein